MGIMVALLPFVAAAEDSENVDAFPVRSASTALHCTGWGDAECVTTDYTFDLELRELGKTATGQPLLESAAHSGLTVQSMPADQVNSVATFVPADNSVRISSAVKTYPLPDRLTILAHELQHADDAANGLPIGTPAGCYSTEEHALATETRLWNELFDEALPTPRTAYEAWLNTASRSPAGVSGVVHSAYRARCDSRSAFP
jgi:hypothetical protein